MSVFSRPHRDTRRDLNTYFKFQLNGDEKFDKLEVGQAVSWNAVDMHTGRHYRISEIVKWTRRETFIFTLLASIPTALYALLGWTWLAMPWVPVALIGTAVAFVTGFKNNASYGRLWEARKIWGALINNSRYWGTQCCDFLAEPESHSSNRSVDEYKQRLVYRHIAFVTALRFQLRQPKTWETMNKRHNVEFQSQYFVDEWNGDLDDALKPLLDEADLEHVLGCKNRATQILAIQSAELNTLVQTDMLNDFNRLFMSRTLAKFYDDQGKSERIKNFPYPRQFATLNVYFIWLFIVFVPFGLLREFDKLGEQFVWLTIPASVIISWVFHTMDKIGESSENPFEGSPNDVPITALARTIEIDLREMIGEKNLPNAMEPVNNILT